MSKTSQELHVFRMKVRVDAEAGTTEVWRFAKDNASRGYEPTAVSKLDDATKFDPEDSVKVAKFYQRIVALRNVSEVEFVKVTLETSIDVIDLNTGELLEERRRQAIQKLSVDDIEALGLEGLAIYEKLKNHKPLMSEPDF